MDQLEAIDYMVKFDKKFEEVRGTTYKTTSFKTPIEFTFHQARVEVLIEENKTEVKYHEFRPYTIGLYGRRQ